MDNAYKSDVQKEEFEKECKNEDKHLRKTMNIWALKGHIVKVTEATVNNGYDFDSEKVKKNLEIEKHYTVKYTNVGQSSTQVVLQEFPDLKFNSVNFVSVTQQPEELNQAHPDYQIWKNVAI